MKIDLNDYIGNLKLLKPKTSDVTITNYRKALKGTHIYEVDTDNLNTVWKALRAQLENEKGEIIGSYGFIEQTVKVIRGALKIHGAVWFKDYDYNILLAKLNQLHGIIEHYPDDMLRDIVTKMQKYPPVFRICVACYYAGLRIGALKGRKYTDFIKVPGYDVRVVTVTTKGKVVTVGISENAYRWLATLNYDSPEIIVPYNPTAKSPFDTLQRQKLIDAFKREGILHYLKGRHPLHSFRHSFTQKLSGLPLLPDDIALLRGDNLEDTTANRHYVDRNELYERIAKAYSKTPLINDDFLPKLEAVA